MSIAPSIAYLVCPTINSESIMHREYTAHATRLGVTLKIENEPDRVCLTRSIQDASPDLNTCWQDVIESSVELHTAHSALHLIRCADLVTEDSFCLTIQRLEAGMIGTGDSIEYNQRTETLRAEDNRIALRADDGSGSDYSFIGTSGYSHTRFRTIVDDDSADRMLHNPRYRSELYS